MTKKENLAEPERPHAEDGVPRTLAAMIRQSSEGGRLISEEEILRHANEGSLFSPDHEDPAAEVGRTLTKLLQENQDLHELEGQDGKRSYYSSLSMTEAYAKILLGKQGDPLRLIAEIVRQNSAFYPRPVALDVFTQPPFDLSAEEVLHDLEGMAGSEEYGDIAATTTSTSRVFLYSSLHLESDHASMLAEWLDVGQQNNP